MKSCYGIRILDKTAKLDEDTAGKLVTNPKPNKQRSDSLSKESDLLTAHCSESNSRQPASNKNEWSKDVMAGQALRIQVTTTPPTPLNEEGKSCY